MALVADDGTVLKPKEGIVVDQNGQPLTAGRFEGHRFEAGGSVRSASFSLPIPAIVGTILFVPLALAMGAAFVSVIGVLLAVFFILSTVSRIFGRR